MQKSKPQYADIDEYISMFPEDVQKRLKELRKVMHELIPDVEEKISYQMPTFAIKGKYVAYFAGFKNHVSLFPFPSGIAEFKEETKDYVTSTGTIQFPNDKPLPWDLIKKIVKFRVKEVLEKQKEKKSKY